MKLNKFSDPKYLQILTIFVPLLIVIVIIGIVALTPVPDLSDALRAEFGEAYLSEIVPSGKIVEFDLEAGLGETEIVPGVKTKVWSYNQQVPGPELKISLGDTLKINFTNNLPQETTIHWHGVRVENSMDGVPDVTQDPIKPGETFIYEFTPKDAGTFWYHPHVRGSEQVERGLFGALIVEDAETYPYYQDITWVVDDWLLTDDSQIYPEFVTQHDLAHDGRWGNLITVNAKLKEQIKVAPGSRIRLRMVNSSNGRVYTPKFIGLEAKVIAVDGMYVGEYFKAGNFELAPGNRLDVEITIPQDASGNSFRIEDRFTRSSNLLGEIVVEGEAVATPEFNSPKNELLPKWDDAVESVINKKYYLNAEVIGGMGMMGRIAWTINGKAYPDYETFELNYDKFNKLSFINESGRLHPMHLHGQFFKVISRNGRKVDEPYFRDTILIGPKERVEIGLVPLDKGTWVQHCHILEHADAGMMSVITVN